MCHPVRRRHFERDLRERKSPAPDPFAGDLRIGDADRERAVDQLRVHAAAGRLSTDELEERLDRAYAARTARELRAELADLPPERAARRVPSARTLPALPFPLVVGLLVAAAFATGAWWLMWLIWPAAILLGRGHHGGHRRLGA